MLVNDDCLNYLKTIDDNTIDSLVTDPPAGISFMGKDWDSNKGGNAEWIAWLTEVMQECLRVLKPGAHGFVWALPRTSHRTVTALENAGFEIRDVVTHLFGSGFPKSHNIGKKLVDWDGWGTALKPASEHWILVRKPLSEKSIVDNVLKHGTGGINIDDCRVGDGKDRISGGISKKASTFQQGKQLERPVGSRFPANLILDEEAGKLLDKQSGILRQCSTIGQNDGKNTKFSFTIGEQPKMVKVRNFKANDYAGASRFFYCAKASKSERGQDNTHPTVKPQKLMQYLIKMVTPPNGTVLDPFMGSGSTSVACKTLGFNFIGIEKDLEYYKIAVIRVNNFNER